MSKEGLRTLDLSGIGILVIAAIYLVGTPNEVIVGPIVVAAVAFIFLGISHLIKRNQAQQTAAPLTAAVPADPNAA